MGAHEKEKSSKIESRQRYSEAAGRAVWEPARRVTVKGEYDVIVCGGGPAGTACSVRAAENGARVLLLERQGALGGTWTQGLMTWLMDVEGKKGFLGRLTEGVKALGSLYGQRKEDHSFSPEDMKYVMEREVWGAGVEVRYQTLVSQVIMEEDSPQEGCRAEVVGRRKERPLIRGVITQSKSGHEAFLAPVIVDATGDGDVAALAGCRYEMGKQGNGEVQPMSMIALVGGLRLEEVRSCCLNYENFPGEAQRHLGEVFEKHGISLSYAMPVLTHLKGDIYALSINHEYGIRCDDGKGISGAVYHARKEITEALARLARAEKCWSDMVLIYTADAIGVREGRRIQGEYRIIKEDMEAGRQFEDGICRVTFNADIHDTTASVNKSWNNGGIKVQPYQIPLRALIAADVTGLVLAGRMISGDFYAHASYRVGGNILAVGEAAGVLAALASLTHTAPQDVAYREVQDRLFG